MIGFPFTLANFRCGGLAAGVVVMQVDLGAIACFSFVVSLELCSGLGVFYNYVDEYRDRGYPDVAPTARVPPCMVYKLLFFRFYNWYSIEAGRLSSTSNLVSIHVSTHAIYLLPPRGLASTCLSGGHTRLSHYANRDSFSSLC